MSNFKTYLVTPEGYKEIKGLSEILFPEIDIKLKEYEPFLKSYKVAARIKAANWLLKAVRDNWHYYKARNWIKRVKK